jgi:retinol dehydrogenase 12
VARYVGLVAQVVLQLLNHSQVVIVTGSNTGVGKETAQILYAKNAKVYLMARSFEKTQTAINDIKTAVPQSHGELIFLPLDLADLQQVKTSAEAFLRREKTLHILFNNAGVAYPEKGSTSKQGYELQLGVNCLGAFTLTKLLTPTLVSTAKVSPANTVRVVWVASSAAFLGSPNELLEKLPRLVEMGPLDKYGSTKLGNYLHATEYAARYAADGVISIPLNPGNLDSDLWRTQGPVTSCLLRKTVLNPPVYGAYTSLFAGVSPEVTLERSGQFGKHL